MVIFSCCSSWFLAGILLQLSFLNSLSHEFIQGQFSSHWKNTWKVTEILMQIENKASPPSSSQCAEKESPGPEAVRETPALLPHCGLVQLKVEPVEINVSCEKHQVITTRADWGSSDDALKSGNDLTGMWHLIGSNGNLDLQPPLSFHLSIQK